MAPVDRYNGKQTQFHAKIFFIQNVCLFSDDERKIFAFQSQPTFSTRTVSFRLGYRTHDQQQREDFFFLRFFFSPIPPTDFLTWCHAHNSTRLCTQTQEQNELFSSRCAGSFVRLLKEAPPTPTTVVNALEKDSSRLECGGKNCF